MIFPDTFVVSSAEQSTCGKKALLTAAIDNLSRLGRLVVCLHYYEGLQPDEIAAVIGVERQVVDNVHAASLTQLHALDRPAIPAEGASISCTI